MGGSCASGLRSGWWPEVEKPLREVAKQLQAIITEVYGAAYEEDQYDNAAQTGALAGELGIALRIIKEALPEEKKETK